MKRLIILPALLGAGPALAAAGDYPFLSLYNTDIVVLLAFLLFIGILVYFKVPGKVTGFLDARTEQIRNDLDEARRLREEAQQLVAGYERKLREVKEQADRIVTRATQEAKDAAEQARRDMDAQVARRLAAAEEQLAASEAEAIRSVRNRAVAVAVAAATEVLAQQMSGAEAAKSIDAGIAEVEARLH
ncbi:F0F1 ATP synthase subunit B [Rhodobaculum claviforme]|uniref:ATP synthase subunit b n=1 Tax=Rhodobaculum claviforme TaxID=1549854 RepID=A0A934TJH6_9RHOB|nr:F0F1 ATP synthase subunit B [Rhodobaculum claviforme]MBK5926768.1 ATP F0F1 synthase subunit B [Rhodobaculum claviforme]